MPATKRTDAPAEEDYTIISVRLLRGEVDILGRLARIHSRARSAEAAYAIRLYIREEAAKGPAGRRRRDAK